MEPRSSSEFKEIPLNDLVINLAQVRKQYIGKDIAELAESIRKVGLLHPILVCPSSEEEGKYEIIAGQRRVLAHKELGVETIKAAVLDESIDEVDAKVLSLTENWQRLGLSRKDEKDICLFLYRRYKSVDLIVDETGLSRSKVQKYLKFSNLTDNLKKLVDNGLDIDAADKAQKISEQTGNMNEEEIANLAKELNEMANVQRKAVEEKAKNKPKEKIAEILEDAKSGEKLTQVIVTLSRNLHYNLQKYAQDESSSQDAAAAELIEEGLLNKGYLEE